MMKILYVIHTAKMDGSTMSLLNLIANLKSYGVEAFVAGPKGDGFLKTKFLEMGVDYREVRIKWSFYPRLGFTFEGYWGLKSIKKLLGIPYRRIGSFIDILRAVRAVNPDIIHTNTGVVREGYWVARALKIPHVWHLREYQDMERGIPVFPSKGIFERMLSNSYVITITDDLQRHFHLMDNPMAKTIYNGIYDADKFSYIWPKGKYFLCASRIVPYKGHDMVIRAFSQFHKIKPDYKLVILGYGNPKWESKLKMMAKELQCEEAIVWEGYKEDVYGYMMNATGLIVSSIHEGFGRMTAEACFAGCLVIGRNNSGTKEIIEKTGGFLFDTEEELVNNMVTLTNLSENQYHQMVTKAQDCSRHLFSIQQNVENTHCFYEQILREKKNGVRPKGQN